MYRHDRNKPIVGSITTIIITVVMAVVMWAPIMLSKYTLIDKILAPVWFVISALSVIWACYSAKTLKTNIVLPVLFITICCGTMGYMDGWYKGCICSLLVLFAYMLLLNIYKQKDDIWRLFDIMFILSASFFIDQSVIWIIPAFIIGLGIFDALSPKNIMACLFGIGIPVGAVASYYYFCDDICMFQHYITDITFDPIFLNLRIADIAAYGCIGIYLLCSIIAFTLDFQKKSIQFRSSISFTFAILWLSLLVSEPLFLVFTSIILSAYVDNNQSKIHKILFYTFLTIMTLIFLAKIVVI